MKNKIIIGIIVALLIGGMIYKLAANKKTIDKNASPIDRSNVPVSVSTFEVNYFTVSTDYALPAVLDNNNTGIITATQPGKLATFNIEIGQHVTKGQLIGKIDSKQREIGIKSSDENIKKFTKTRDVQDMATEILLAIEEELEITGIKGDFEIIFGKIQQSSTPTGEFDGMYHLIELELVSYKEI